MSSTSPDPAPAPLRIPHPQRRGMTSQSYLSLLSGILLTISYFVLFLGVSIIVLLPEEVHALVGVLVLLSGIVMLILEKVIFRQLSRSVDNERGKQLKEHIAHYMALLRPGSHSGDPSGWIDNTKRTDPPSPVFQPIYEFLAVVEGVQVVTKAYLTANYIFLHFSEERQEVRVESRNVHHRVHEIEVPAPRNLENVARMVVMLGTIVSWVVFACVSITVMLRTYYEDTMYTALAVALLSALPILFSLGIAHILRKVGSLNEEERRSQISEIISFTLESNDIKAPVIDEDDMTSENALGGQAVWLPLIGLAANGDQCQVDIIPKGKTKFVLRVRDLMFG